VDGRFDDDIPRAIHQAAQPVALTGRRILEADLPASFDDDEVAAFVTVGEGHFIGETDASAVG
jgi:hypothetical protein